jgi:hypothetical protein
VRSDNELLTRTLSFSGSYVSDDGTVIIRRSRGGSAGYSGDRFVGNCGRCARARLIPATGAALLDNEAAARFVANHAHGEID